jgi:ABC-type transport system involved in multi-copper enzyme maturation permease subunit
MHVGANILINSYSQIAAIAGKEIIEARRTYLLFWLTSFLLFAAMISLTVSAVIMHQDFADYVEARDFLVAAGKSTTDLVQPNFFPMKLLRGFIEHIEIIGAILGIVLGYRAAATERGNSTLALILTRPLSQWIFIAGKLLGNVVLISFGLAVTFVIGTIALALISGVGLAATDLLRILLVFIAAVFYVVCFFMFSFILSLNFKRLPSALLVAFSVWLTLVLIAPQIGDTMDPDNQVAGGVFKTLGIAKPLEKEILKTFATYETIRDDIEQTSPSKHFERLSFALLGIKDIYNGQALGFVLREKWVDLWWMAGTFIVLLAGLFLRRLNFSRLTKEI